MFQDCATNSTPMGNTRSPIDHVLDFNKPELCIRTTPISCKIRDVEIPIIGKQNWISVLVAISNMFIMENNPKINELNKHKLSPHFSRPFILEHKINERNHARLINGCWIYVNLGIPMLIRTIRALCIYCGLNLRDVEIKYIAKENSNPKAWYISVDEFPKIRENDLDNHMLSHCVPLSWNEQIASDFRLWMKAQGMADATARGYSSAVRVVIQKYPEAFEKAQKFNTASEGIGIFIKLLENIKDYTLMNEKSHNQHKAALKKFCAYIDESAKYLDFTDTDTVQSTTDVESRVLDIIGEKFPEGLRLGFLDISKLRSFYAEEYKNELALEDSILYELIRKNTVCVDDSTERYSRMSNLVGDETLAEIEKFIDSQFAEGRQRVYIEQVFNIFCDNLSVVVNVNTLISIIEIIFGYKYKINRLSKFVSLQHNEPTQQINDEICDAIIQLLEYDIVPSTIEEIEGRFPGYPHNKILGVLNGNLVSKNGDLIVSLDKLTYAHVEYVYLSEKDLIEIIKFISRGIESIGYKTTDDLFDDIRMQISDVIDNNEGIDKIGIMKAIRYHTGNLFAVTKKGQSKVPSFDAFIALSGGGK